MDADRKRELIASVAGQSLQLVPIQQFFDGNDDLGSIGCNLVDHPGIETFEKILVGLLRRSDVEAVYAQIYELDPGDGCWPFADTILVVGDIAVEDLGKLLEPLEPDEVEPMADVPEVIKQRHRAPVLYAWWD
jgi:hypothetical protein